ncbi:methyltransferase family protein [Blastopirellula retiformator]|uniref:Isoprenylcysteine carboxyl methyltransferase (ICMT) family protein n=1 Tax=Blastopirellula retiformator TaxID=2527970 RepID=A0A5C5VKJ2_9BACT|nr:isoprenylcysteine carboxylmethyltransferase family protein [Blastopirellula retiformator]TWT39134.1 Isoprenylcysteine carboxyl methyltransferase (ICMT) family protein [Blastopirellula retiformator]
MSANANPSFSPTEIDLPNFKRQVWETCTNIAMAAFFFRFAWVQGEAFFTWYRLSTFLILVKVSTDVFFYLIRKPPKNVSMSLYDWAVGLMGTYAVILFMPAGQTHDSLFGQIVQCTGIGLQIFAMASLNRSIGIVAANRGIKTDGMYRYVRHPLYLSYVVAYGGYMINQTSYWNVSVYCACVLLWLMRIMAEERLLMQDEQYQEFAQRVRWKLIPGLV